MTSFASSQRSSLHLKLLALRDELRQSLALSEAGSRPVALDQQAIGRLSRMEAIQARHLTEAGRRSARSRLDQVEAALRRLERGEYGLCAGCEDEIALARLQARP